MREYDSPKLMETHGLTALLPRTFQFLVMPINDKLIALVETKEKAALSATELKAATEQFREWHKRHLVRVVAGGVAWVLGTIAVILF